MAKFTAPEDTSTFQALLDHAGENAREMLHGMLARYPNLAAFVDATSRRRRLLSHLAPLREGKASQRELAKRIGSHQPTIANLEKGQGDPRLSTLERYAASLDLIFFWQLLTPDGAPAAPGYTWPGDIQALHQEMGLLPSGELPPGIGDYQQTYGERAVLATEDLEEEA